jgi:hypothetical protein
MLNPDSENAMTALTTTAMRELHSRSSDGIYVRMLWNEHTGRVTVAVTDSKTNDAFVVDVRESDRAMDVFHHPYAYAAWREVETRTSAPAPAHVIQLAA